ncbi:Ribonuclease H-like domain containing protein [Canna indica]|uniref:Ribonuclease H-like domain containing protein n=1 Tax=Canna indica TaxID=4628 RepID=A0AAQ3Q531_9LILI|nr:Ribonuclease H-like domain containing protein [Canna indica]
MFSDCLRLINILNNNFKPPWSIKNLISDIILMSDNLQIQGWLHINRELNVAAHNLAKQAMRNNTNCSSSESNIYIWKHVQDDHPILNGHSDSECNSLFSLSYFSLLQAVRNNVNFHSIFNKVNPGEVQNPGLSNQVLT